MKTDNRFYHIWYGMVARCDNPNNHAYNHYGDRGIKVSDRWHDYKLFTEDMYESYQEHVKEFGENQTTLDRIDVNGDYCLENCRWATRKEQSNNRRNNVYLDSDETLTEFCERNKLDYDLIYSRLQRGWTLEDAISKAKIIGKKSISPTGETLTEASIRLNIPRKTLESRLKRGWSLEKTINTPLQTKYRKKC